MYSPHALAARVVWERCKPTDQGSSSSLWTGLDRRSGAGLHAICGCALPLAGGKIQLGQNLLSLGFFLFYEVGFVWPGLKHYSVLSFLLCF